MRIWSYPYEKCAIWILNFIIIIIIIINNNNNRVSITPFYYTRDEEGMIANEGQNT